MVGWVCVTRKIIMESQRKTSCHRACKAAVKHALPVATVPSKLILKPSEAIYAC